MENQKEVASDGEDIPSDFFDDFNKDEFMEGLSVVDSWDDEEKKARSSRSRINVEALDSVRDLRELIGGEENEKRPYVKPDSSFRWRRKSPAYEERKDRHQLDSDSHLDDFIKPGSRRDPNKTNEAIKKDKEVKVKEYLAKHLESSSNLCPPGTELDDFFENRKSIEAKNSKSVTISVGKISPVREQSSPVRRRRESPVRDERKMRHRATPQRYRREHWSPRRQHYGPHRIPRPANRYHSPQRNFRKFHRRSPRRITPELRRERRSKSSYKRYRRQSRSRSSDHQTERDRSRSPSRKAGKDDFLYPKDYFTSPEYSTVKGQMAYHVEIEPQYAKPIVEYGATTSYTYAPASGQAYNGLPFGVLYEYGAQPNPQMVIPVPQPVPDPIMSTPTIDPVQPATEIPSHIPMSTMTSPPVLSTPILESLTLNPVQASPVPTHTRMSKNRMTSTSLQKIPHEHPDALAKLVADGILSHEDYLKLAPNKGVSKNMDTMAKVAVMKRCHSAMSRLGAIMLPNQLVINNTVIGPEMKQIAPKFCSPLKRQPTLEFPFTSHNTSSIARQNKLILDSIVAALGIDKFLGRKKKVQKETKDAAVQTMKPFCDVCEIRENMEFSDATTSIDRESFTSTVHTQVVEQNLISSKSVFNPSGAMIDSANISIAHMTPAQLVSQLVARAKTLKQSDQAASSNQYRQQNYDYDYDRGDDNQYRNKYNYRY